MPCVMQSETDNEKSAGLIKKEIIPILCSDQIL